ncbi:E3 ubiquitin-protein ligase ZNRF2 [Crotalus adamanteus]|uniref:RING-type E3 ubiquitin transferase n=1 Tax=Crotalus adamanteus TaxID=8729 RepID=A0AAW1B3G1_CROAD
MGAKQSGPAATNGRTRAYSGGDLPSGSSSGGINGTGGRPIGGAMRYTHLAPGAHHAASGSSTSSGATTAAPPLAAPRSRSLGGPTVSGARAAHSAFHIPNSSGLYGSQDSVSSTPEEGGRERATASGGAEGPGEISGGPRLVIGSLPAHLSPHLFGGKDSCPAIVNTACESGEWGTIPFGREQWCPASLEKCREKERRKFSLFNLQNG